MKFSKQRQLVLNYISNSKNHPTADNVYEELKRDNPNISLGTVYRNLAFLEEKGFILKVSIPGQPVRYDSHLEGHDHFICERCGKIIDIEREDTDLDEDLYSHKGFKINSKEVFLKGICNDCLKKGDQ